MGIDSKVRKPLGSRRGALLTRTIAAAGLLVVAAAAQAEARGSIPVLVQVTNNTTGDVLDPRLRSQDGNRIVFTSDGDVTGPAPGHKEVYLYQIETGVMIRVTNTVDGESSDAARSTDQVFNAGRPEFVAFISTGDLDPDGDNSDHNPEVFLWELESGVFHQLTTTASTVVNKEPYTSDSGKCIVFSSNADLNNNTGEDAENNPGTGYTNADGSFEVFLYTIDSNAGFPHDGNFTQVSNGPAGSNSTRPVVGGYWFPRQCQSTAYMSDYDQTGSGLTGTHIFVFNRPSAEISRMETREIPWGIPSGAYLYPNMSSASPFARGPFVVFQSDAPVWRNGSEGMEMYRYRIFHPRMTQYTDILTGNVERPVISDGGGYIAFQSNGEILDPRHKAKGAVQEPPYNADGNYEIFRTKGRRKTWQITNTTGCVNNLPSVRDDGTAIVFRSTCDLIEGRNPGGVPQVFLYKEVKRDDPLGTAAGCLLTSGCCNEANGCYKPLYGRKPPTRKKECMDKPRVGCKPPPA
jgi:Tol biopolymer transport system component